MPISSCPCYRVCMYCVSAGCEPHLNDPFATRQMPLLPTFALGGPPTRICCAAGKKSAYGRQILSWSNIFKSKMEIARSAKIALPLNHLTPQT